MSKSRRPQQSNRPGQSEISPDLIKKFFTNQTKELENRSKELDIVKFDKEQSYSYATKALELQAKDREDERRQKTLFMKYGVGLTIILVILFAGFVAGCFYTDNVDIIVSILKIFAYVIPSAAGGYFIGLNKGKKNGFDQNVELIDD